MRIRHRSRDDADSGGTPSHPSPTVRHTDAATRDNDGSNRRGANRDSGSPYRASSHPIVLREGWTLLEFRKLGPRVRLKPPRT